MRKSKSEKPKNKGGRPRKETELHKGDTAAKRFSAAFGNIMDAGPTPPKKPR